MFLTIHNENRNLPSWCRPKYWQILGNVRKEGGPTSSTFGTFKNFPTLKSLERTMNMCRSLDSLATRFKFLLDSGSILLLNSIPSWKPPSPWMTPPSYYIPYFRANHNLHLWQQAFIVQHQVLTWSTDCWVHWPGPGLFRLSLAARRYLALSDGGGFAL